MSRNHNSALVDFLIEERGLKDKRVVAAFRVVDRGKFVPPSKESYAYNDRPLSIGEGQTISAPHMVAMMSEALNVKEGDNVLEVGAGSGYQAAILAELVGKEGRVFTVERIKSIVEFARKNLEKYENVEVIEGDGTLGYEKEAPYDRVMVTAAAPKVPPALVEQMKVDGMMAIPVGGRSIQEFVLIKKTKDGVERHHVCGCVFVPLIGEEGWLRGD